MAQQGIKNNQLDQEVIDAIATGGGAPTLIALTDTPVGYGTAGQVLATNGSVDGTEWVNDGTNWATPVDNNIIPDTDSVYNLGSPTETFNNGYFDSTFFYEGGAYIGLLGTAGTEFRLGSNTNIDLRISSAGTGKIYFEDFGGTGVDFSQVTGTIDFTGTTVAGLRLEDLADTPAGYGTAGQVLATNGTSNGTEWVTSGGGGDLWGDPVDANIIPDASPRNVGTFTQPFATVSAQTYQVMYATSDRKGTLSTTSNSIRLSSEGDHILRVKGENGPVILETNTAGTYGNDIEFITTSGGVDFTGVFGNINFTGTTVAGLRLEDLADTPAGYGTAGQVLATNGTANGTEWITSGGGATWASLGPLDQAITTTVPFEQNIGSTALPMNNMFAKSFGFRSITNIENGLIHAFSATEFAVTAALNVDLSLTTNQGDLNVAAGAGGALNLNTSGADVTVAALFSGDVIFEVGFGGKIFTDGPCEGVLTTIPALSIDFRVGDCFEKSISADSTVTFNTPPTTGCRTSVIAITADGTNREVTFPATVRWKGGTAITTVLASSTTIYTLVWINGTAYATAVDDLKL